MALCVMALSACIPPPPDIVTQIKNACAIDAQIRPTVIALEVFATPQEVMVINTARSVIDPICANPNGTIASNTLAILINNIATIQGIVISIQNQKSSAK